MPQRQISLEDKRSDSPEVPVEPHEVEVEEGEPPLTSTQEPTDVLQEKLEPETEKACTTLRAILNANIGACHVKLVS